MSNKKKKIRWHGDIIISFSIISSRSRRPGFENGIDKEFKEETIYMVNFSLYSMLFLKIEASLEQNEITSGRKYYFI